MDIQGYDERGEKKKLLDSLEENDGDLGKACHCMGLEPNTVDTWLTTDEIFKDAIEQIQAECALSLQNGELTPAMLIGIRPYDLRDSINSRLEEEGNGEKGVSFKTAKKMCSFLSHYRNLGWNTAQACATAKVSTASLYGWLRRFPEFNHLYETAERDSISEIYDVARKRALDPTASGDAMRSFILGRVGHKIGMGNDNLGGTKVEVNVQNSVRDSDAIVRAHEKAIEASMNIITITGTDND